MKVERKDFLHKLKNIITEYEQIILIPHAEVDLDALGSCLGFYSLLSKYNKNTLINIEEDNMELGVSRAIHKTKELRLNINYEKLNNINYDAKTLLIMLDHHKREMSQNPDIYNIFNDVIVLDHHVENKNNSNNILKYVDDEASSTSEIVCDFLKEEKCITSNYILTVMLAGITVDTNKFTIKTSSKTHEVASYLTNCGANTKEVQYLLKEDLLDYISMQKLIFKTEIYKNEYAITIGNKTQIYDKEQLAKIADSLLQFDGVEASFVIGKINTNIIGISARSMGNIDVEYIMKKLNGGGHRTDAACQMYNCNLKNAYDELVKIINKL